MPQQKCFTLSRLEPAQRVLYLIVQRHLIRGMIRRCAIHSFVASNHPPLALCAPRGKCPALVHYYLIQPRSKLVRIAALGEVPERANERELKRIIGVLETPEHVRREPRVRVAVPVNENAVRVGIAGEHCRHDAGVGALGEASMAHTQ